MEAMETILSCIDGIEGAETYPDYTDMIAAFYNQQEGKLQDGDCPECKNRGYIVINKGGTAMARICGCVNQRKYIAAMRNCGLGNLYQRYTFAAYKITEQWQKDAKEGAALYASQPNTNDWLYIAGQSGSGKTHLCTAICTYLVKAGRDITYKRWQDLLAVLQRSKYRAEEQDEIMGEVMNADVLYIDDFLKTADFAKPASDELMYAFRIVDSRYCSGKKTMVSTEFFLSEIERFDTALFGRIVERAEGHIIQMGRGGEKNMRIKNGV